MSFGENWLKLAEFQNHGDPRDNMRTWEKQAGVGVSVWIKWPAIPQLCHVKDCPENWALVLVGGARPPPVRRRTACRPSVPGGSCLCSPHTHLLPAGSSVWGLEHLDWVLMKFWDKVWRNEAHMNERKEIMRWRGVWTAPLARQRPHREGIKDYEGFKRRLPSVNCCKSEKCEWLDGFFFLEFPQQ